MIKIIAHNMIDTEYDVKEMKTLQIKEMPINQVVKYLMEDSIPKRTDYNVKQCWNCRNMIGAKGFKINGVRQLLPECKVENKYMTYVYDNPCRSLL